MECMKAVIRGPSLEKDRGYAWIVLFMSCLSRSASLGFTIAILGNLTIAHQYHLGISLQQSSTLVSVHISLLCLLAPVASVLTKKLGCRITMVGGGGCLIIAFAMLSISTELSHVYVFFGVIAAFGSSAAIMSGSEILALNFDRYKYLAFSLTNLGYYVGTAVWPSISLKLLDEFGYSKAMGIMSTLHVIHMLAGITFYQPGEVTGPIQNDSIIKTSSDTHREVDKEALKNETKRENTLFSEDIKTLLSNFNILVLLASGFLWNLCSITFLILINDYCLMVTEISAEAASFGITIIGIAHIVGCLGVIGSSSRNFDRLILHATVILLHWVSTILMAFVKRKVMYYVLAVIWGSSKGALIANLLAVANDLCGPEKLALLFGLHLFAEGLGSLVGSPLCGIIARYTSAEYTIILPGICGVLGGLIIIPILISKARKANEDERLSLKAIVINNMNGVNKPQNVTEKITEPADEDELHIHYL